FRPYKDASLIRFAERLLGPTRGAPTGRSVAAGGIMVRLSRRRFGRGALAASAATLVGAPAVWAQKDLQTLRLGPEAALTILDPIWTTGYVTRNYGYLVYDTLFGMDENFNIRPQMVERTTVSPDGMKYTFRLRDGLRWHDGLPVESEDCVESLKRW